MTNYQSDLHRLNRQRYHLHFGRTLCPFSALMPDRAHERAGTLTRGPNPTSFVSCRLFASA